VCRFGEFDTVLHVTNGIAHCEDEVLDGAGGCVYEPETANGDWHVSNDH